MITKELRNHFRIFVLHDLVDKGAQLRNELVEAGYPTFLFNDEDLLMVGFKQDQPHIILFRTNALSSPLDSFVQTVLEINDEVLFIAIADNMECEALGAYRDFNFSGVLTVGSGLSMRALWMLDEVCEKLALTYHNEQLKDESELLRKSQQNEKAKAADLTMQVKKLQQEGDKTRPLGLSTWQGITDRELLVDLFFRSVFDFNQGTSLVDSVFQTHAELCGLYLRYLPSVRSFVVTSTSGSSDLHTLHGKNLASDASLPEFMAKFAGTSDFWSQKFNHGSVSDSILVIWPARNIKDKIFLQNQAALFEIFNEKMNLQQRVRSLEINDASTGLYLNSFFQRRLEEEVARARRLEKPVSVVYFAMDQEGDWKTRLTAAQRESALRVISQMIQKSSRVCDVGARLGDNQFAVLLPHTSRRGASVRAERIRRMVETQSVASLGVRLTVSCGISEYPTLAASPEELNRMAFEALQFIRKKGANKLAQSKVPFNFKPHFDVPPT